MFIFSKTTIWNTDRVWTFSISSNSLTRKTQLVAIGPIVKDGETIVEVLGVYETEERALEVLQEIGKALAYGLKAFMLPEE